MGDISDNIDNDDEQLLFKAECDGKVKFVGTASDPVAKEIYELRVYRKKIMNLGLAILAATAISAGIAYVYGQESIPVQSTTPAEGNTIYEASERDQ